VERSVDGVVEVDEGRTDRRVSDPCGHAGVSPGASGHDMVKE
jgi:hypothetical protein